MQAASTPWDQHSCQVCGSSDLKSIESKTSLARQDPYHYRHRYRCGSCGAEVKVSTYRVVRSANWPEVVNYLYNSTGRVLAYATLNPCPSEAYAVAFFVKGMTDVEIAFVRYKLMNPENDFPHRAGRLAIEG